MSRSFERRSRTFGAGSNRGLPILLAISLSLGACGGGWTFGPSGGGAPQIASFSPPAGSAGSQVQITGTGFSATSSADVVRFNGVAASVVSASTTQLVALVPAQATSGPIEISVGAAVATSAARFAVLSGSAPGTQFTTLFDGPAGSPSSLAWTGSRLVATGGAGVQVSDDGSRWSTTLGAVDASAVGWDGNRLVAVGAAGSIWNSADGLTWSAAAPAASGAANLASVAGSGTFWVAVGAAGTILSSPDGTTWTARAAPTARNLRAVIWTGTQFLAAGDGGVVVASGSGTAWAAVAQPTSDPIVALAASPSTIVAATAPSSPSQPALMTSSDGRQWASRGANLGPFSTVAFAGGRFVAVGSKVAAATSADGMTWSQGAAATDPMSALAWQGNEYLALGTDRNGFAAVFVSGDGLAWSMSGGAQNLHALARSALDGRLVATGALSDASRTSPDSAAWSFGEIGSAATQNYPFVDVVWAPAVNAFVALARVGTTPYVYKSVDGSSWTGLGVAPCDGTLAASAGAIVNIGSAACLASSSDAIGWTARAVAGAPALGKAFWTGSQFVAVGAGGAIATSADGTTWTARAGGVSSTLNGAAASPSTIVVVGSGGTLLASTDGGASWSARASGTTSTLWRAVWTGSQFFAVGAAGTLLESADGATWSSLPTPYTGDIDDVAWSAGASGARLVLVGDGGLTATSP